MSVYVANESGVEVDEVRLVALARHVLADLGVAPLAELSIMLYDAAAMERLHEQFMGEPGPTDVLAFPQDDLSSGAPLGGDDLPEALLGDVVICPQVAERQAQERGHTAEHELHVLCTHGVLHLLGYDHADADTEREMFALQGRLLDGWHAARSG